MSKNYTNLVLKILICSLAVVFVLGMTRVAFAHPHPEIFELDAGDAGNPSANAVTDHSGSGLPDDWDRIGPHTNPAFTPPNPGPNHSALSVFATDPGDSSIFTTGGSKDVNNMNQWRWTNGSVLDKDDLLDGYAALYPVADSSILWFGTDRFANNGDADLGFWFFVNHVGLNPNGTFTSNGADTVRHTDGDILMLSTFTQGGGVSTIELYRWVVPGD